MVRSVAQFGHRSMANYSVATKATVHHEHALSWEVLWRNDGDAGLFANSLILR